MTLEILIVLGTTGIAALLFVTERLRMDLVALLVLAALALTGVVSPEQAISGFSSPAVVTVWAVFILSGGLERTGVAQLIGRQVLRLAGSNEIQLVTAIMTTAGIMSAFMNNVGVAALMLPVVMDIARRTGRPASRLLMPLAFGSLLGGLTTLIGTPPNILMATILRDAGLQSFEMFDYTPIGAAVMVVGIAYMALLGRRLLPDRNLAGETTEQLRPDWRTLFDLQERHFVVRVPLHSPLVGRSLDQSGLGAALGLNVIGVTRQGRTHLAPGPTFILQGRDRLLVQGRMDLVSLLSSDRPLLAQESTVDKKLILRPPLTLVAARIPDRSALAGKTLQTLDFRRRYDLHVIAIRREDQRLHSRLKHRRLRPGDVLLAHVPPESLETLRQGPELEISEASERDRAEVAERLTALRVPDGSALVGRPLAESHLPDILDITVLGIQREGRPLALPGPDTVLQAGDTLLLEGNPKRMQLARSLASLEIESGAPDFSQIESGRVGLIEAILSPHSALPGSTLRQIHFRDKYGLTVLAIWREGQALRSNLAEIPLRLGDALLVYGEREKLRLLGSEPDFVVLSEATQEPTLQQKLPLAALIMGLVLLPVALGWLPIFIAAVAGAVLMVMTGCLTMEEAYRFIDWRSVFLIAGMLPLGIALEQTGAAGLMAQTVVSSAGGFGPLGVVVSIYLLTALATQVIPNPAVAVLMAPIALGTAATLDLSPHALAMVVAIAASGSFLSPVSHPANVLVMGPGGYRFSDYLKVGLPLTALSLAVVLVVLPIVWPLSP